MPRANSEMARDLARLSCDCSFLLTHLVRQTDGHTALDARRILEAILDLGASQRNPKLRSSSVGWYASAAGASVYNPESGAFDLPVISRAVCFTESTLAGLKAHRDVFNARYGLAFDRDLLYGKGANPCLNIRDSLLRAPVRPGPVRAYSVYNYMPAKLQPFVNIITEGFDATHEREWRFPGDLAFRLDEVLFVFCPGDDFALFSSVQTNGRPMLFDLALLDRV